MGGGKRWIPVLFPMKSQLRFFAGNRPVFSSFVQSIRILFAVVAVTLGGRSMAQTPAISFSMGFSSETVGVGSCAELTFQIQNADQVPVDQLAFALNLPDGIALAHPAGMSNDCGGVFGISNEGRTVFLTGGMVEGGTTCQASVGLILQEAGPFELTTSNLTFTGGNVGGASASLGVPIDGPSLGFSKRFLPGPISLGGQARLVYTIQNQSDADAVGIAFDDDLSPGLVVAPDPGIENGCENSSLTAIAGSQQIVLSGGTLAAGETCTISLDVVGLTAGSNFSKSGEISSSFPGEEAVTSGRACAVLEVIAPEDLANISFSKSFLQDSMTPGGTGLLEFTITNNSATEAFSGIEFQDDLGAMLPGAVAVDLPLAGGYFLQADFEGTGGFLLGPTWDYLDRLQNENGRSDNYPVDDEGVDWNEADFDTATSSVGPWSSGNAPLQGGEVDAFPPGTPSVLGGIDAAPNGQNLVTTYLFRQEFDLDRAQSEITDWLVDYVFDDGAIIYVNGVEIFRSPSMPLGPVSPLTLSGLGEETGRTSSPVDLSGLLVEGTNTIAVELHQTSLESSDAGFFLDLFPASTSPTAGFSYADDTFDGTNDAGFSDGSLDQAGGFAGGGLTVITGGKGFFSFLNPPSSGGWSRTFTVDEAGVIPVSFRYRMVFDSTYEDDELSRALFELDGVRYGNGPNNSLAEFVGGTGADQDTGWQTFSADIFLTEGEHTILLGVFNSKSSQATELTQVWFDDIEIGTAPTPAEICGEGSQIVGSDVLEFTGGQLAPGQSCSFRVGIQVPVTAVSGEYLNVTSLISTTVGQETLVGLPAADDLLVETIPPQFTASFEPEGVAVGGVSRLTFTIDNRESFLEGADLSFTNTLPEGLVIAEVPGISTTCGGVVTAVPGGTTIDFAEGAVPSGDICTVAVNVVGESLGDFVNTSGVLTSSLGQSGAATAELVVNPPPGFFMEFVPASIDAGQLSTLIFTIDNSASNVPADNVTFVHELPEGLVVASPSNPVSTCEGGILSAVPLSDLITFTGGSVPAGVICTVRVNVTGREGGSFLNVSGELSSSLGESGFASDTLDVRAVVSVGLTASRSRDSVVAGSGPDNLILALTVRNDGPSSATGIEIPLEVFAPEGVGWRVNETVGTYNIDSWSIPILAAGQSETLTYTITVERNAPTGLGGIRLSGRLDAVDQPDLDASDDAASASADIVSVVDIALQMAESAEPVIAASGPSNLVYTVTATNSGPSDAAGVSVREILNLPPGVIIESVVPSVGDFEPSVDPNGGLWTFNLPVGELETLDINLTVTGEAPDESVISSSAALEELSGLDSNPANNSAVEETSVLAGVDLVVTTEVSDEVVVAGSGMENLTYTVSVTNNGPLVATGVELTSNLLFGDGVEVHSVTPGAGVFDDPVWSIETLPVGATETLTFVVTVRSSAAEAAPGFEGTTAVTAVDQTQIALGDEGDSSSSDITREIDLVLSADESRDPVLAGFDLPGNLLHSFTLSNSGPSDASGVEIDLSGLVPEGAVVESLTPAPGTSIDDQTWSVGSLASGQSVALVYTFGVPAEVIGGLDLIASNAVVANANELLLNPEDDSSGIATSVVSPSSAGIEAGAIALDLQTGLFKQTLKVTNGNPVDLPAFRILVSGLPDGVSVHNAQGAADGQSFLLYNQVLAAGESVDLVVEFFQADASGGFEAQFEIQLVDAVEVDTAVAGVEVDRCEVLDNGDVLIEFAAEMGALYTVQYSEDGEAWINVVPDVLAGGTRVQWIDNGPPKTASHPAGEKRRFYRLFNKETAE